MMNGLHKYVLAALTISSLTIADDDLYTKRSSVIQLTAKTYDSLITKSNHTSIIKFYAPWCGHCKNLKPAYEKVATSLAGLAKVAALNCDEDANKGLCGQMGVQGFPTIKIVKPGSKPGRPIVEDYQGQRTAKAMVDAVVDKIPNHVKRIQDSGLTVWLEDKATPAKAILFTEKGITSALIKALAVDFLGNIGFAQIRNKEKEANKKFGITEYPTVVLIPAPEQEPIKYAGDLKKEALVKFFSQVAPPNPDPAPKKAKASTSKKAKAASATASSKFAKASEAHKSSDYEDHMQGEGTTIVADEPIDSPLPIVDHGEKPMVVKDAAPAIPHLQEPSQLEAACLEPKSGNCILILLPKIAETEVLPEVAMKVLSSFAEVADRFKKRQASIFPFFGVPSTNQAAATIRKALELEGEQSLQIIAINKKRKWWRLYSAKEFNVLDVESFVDAIKLGEGAKNKLPTDFYSVVPSSQAKSESEQKIESSMGAEQSAHDEL